jgi:hypothetical protein
MSTTLPEFVSFPHIKRISRDCIITEKLDGTNAQVCVQDDGTVLAGSRNRWLTSADDNCGFAAWVAEHQDELRTGLGIGTHYGEWWGQGIQRRYGLKQKRFSLFNVTRWKGSRPECCDIVPVLFEGLFTTENVDRALGELATKGSMAAPGFMDPEGVVIYHVASGTLFKKTLKGDGHKSIKPVQAVSL